MKITNIKQKLIEMDFELANLSLGDIDRLGEFCAKKMRDPSDPLYRTVGAFYRPNYERAILVYALIRTYGLTSMLEIGTGRGMVTFAAAKAFHDMGTDGSIVTVDPNLNEQYMQQLRSVFPGQWFNMIEFFRGTSRDYFENVERRDAKFDLVYVDGAHDLETVKFDIENCSRACISSMLCDDYHLPSKNDPGIQCREAIDAFDWKERGFIEPVLIKMDRRIFFDDRGLTDVDYGQVLFTKSELNVSNW